MSVVDRPELRITGAIGFQVHISDQRRGSSHYWKWRMARDLAKRLSRSDFRGSKLPGLSLV